MRKMMKVGISKINDHKYFDLGVKNHTSNTKSNFICRKTNIIPFFLDHKVSFKRTQILA